MVSLKQGKQLVMDYTFRLRIVVADSGWKLNGISIRFASGTSSIDQVAHIDRKQSF